MATQKLPPDMKVSHIFLNAFQCPSIERSQVYWRKEHPHVGQVFFPVSIRNKFRDIHALSTWLSMLHSIIRNTKLENWASRYKSEYKKALKVQDKHKCTDTNMRISVSMCLSVCPVRSTIRWGRHPCSFCFSFRYLFFIRHSSSSSCPVIWALLYILSKIQ